MNQQQGMDRPFSVSTNATMIPGPPGFNPTWMDPSAQNFNSTNYQTPQYQNHQSLQGTPVPPSSEFSNNMLRSYAMNPNPEFIQPNQSSSNPLSTSIVTQHFSNKPSAFPNQMPFSNQNLPQMDTRGSGIGQFSAYPPSTSMIPAGQQAPSGINSSHVYHDTKYVPTGSSNINQIANQIRQSQVRSSRMQAFSNAGQIRQSNVVIQNPSGVVPLPVDDNQRQRRTRVCGCPRWFCVFFILLLFLLAAGAVIYLLKANDGDLWKAMSKIDTCPNGSNRYGTKCVVCPPNTIWSGAECIKSASTDEINEQTLVGVDAPIIEEPINEDQCKKGFVKYLGRCLKCPQTSTWNGTDCTIKMLYPPNVSSVQIIQKKIVKVPVPPRITEKQTVMKPEVKDPISNKKQPQKEVIETLGTPSCEPGYVYHQNGCVPLIGHKSYAKYAHLRGQYAQK